MKKTRSKKSRDTDMLHFRNFGSGFGLHIEDLESCLQIGLENPISGFGLDVADGRRID